MVVLAHAKCCIDARSLFYLHNNVFLSFAMGFMSGLSGDAPKAGPALSLPPTSARSYMVYSITFQREFWLVAARSLLTALSMSCAYICTAGDYALFLPPSLARFGIRTLLSSQLRSIAEASYSDGVSEPPGSDRPTPRQALEPERKTQ